MAKKTAKKKIKTTIKKSKKKVVAKKKKKKKKKAKSSTTKGQPKKGRNTEESPSPQARTDRRGRDISHLIQYQFKKGQKGLPGAGRPKGSVGITARITKLLQLPVRFPGKKDIRQDYTYADLLAEMAVKAANNQDFRFFKEIWDRVDGKVPDHVVMESTKRMVAQEAATLAQELLGVVGETIDDYLDDDRAEAFMTALGDRWAAKFTDEPGEESDELKEFLTSRGEV